MVKSNIHTILQMIKWLLKYNHLPEIILMHSKITKELQENNFSYIKNLSLLLGEDDADLVKQFKQFWSRLERDIFFDPLGHRDRAIARFSVAENNEITMIMDSSVTTHNSYNTISNEINRLYQYAEQDFISHSLTKKIVLFNAQLAREILNIEKVEMVCSLFRVWAEDEDGLSKLIIQPHRDGVSLISMHFIASVNIEGAVSSLYDKEQNLITNSIIKLSEFTETMLVDDRELLHDVTPIKKIDPQQLSYRDMLIFFIDETQLGLSEHARYI